MTALYISLADITKHADRDRTTIWRWMRRKGIRVEGHSVSIAQLQEKWPDMLKALAIVQPKPLCPCCAGEMMMSCTACGHIAT